MARLGRYSPAGIPQHVIQRGNNKQACFAAHEDMAAYAHWLFEASQKYGLAIHSWVFMTNHVHLLVTPEAEDSLSRSIQYLGRHYVRYFNKEYGRTGTLFEGRFKSCVVEQSNYFLVCERYIELNPVRAGMVEDPADYMWSSYRSNALGQKSKLWTPHQEYLSLGVDNAARSKNYRSLFLEKVDGSLLNDIRQAANKGLALGSDKFKDEIEALGNRRQRLMRRGPKARG